MEYREYNTYEEKIEALKEVFGQFPPLFQPVYAVQVSQPRCGSNALWDIVGSFFDQTIHGPTFEGMDDKEWMENNPEHNWIPAHGKKYLYYNVHSLDVHRLHFPIFFWLLQNSPKIIHLTREDHLTRAISIYYANLVWNEREGQNLHPLVPKVNRRPMDFEKLEFYIEESIYQIEVMKSVLSKFVEKERLLQISHQDLYHSKTLSTIGQLHDFLEVETADNRILLPIKVKKETIYDVIPNKQEILDKYERDLSEKPYWVPEDINVSEIEKEVEAHVEKMIQLNVQPHHKHINLISRQETRHKGLFDLQADQQFYIEEIPKSATPMGWREFIQLPDPENEIYMVDDRWEDPRALTEKDVPSWASRYTETIDIQNNRTRSSYEWVCGFSVFFMKNTQNIDHGHRSLPEMHEKLMRGVELLIGYPEKCPDMLLRFYVSPEAWDRLSEKGILYRPDTEFYKMRYDSEESMIGAIWRMLCLSDTQFEWAIQADCAPDEDWIFDRIRDHSRPFFKNWLNNKKTFNWAGEYLISDNNWYTGGYEHNFNPVELSTWTLDNIGFMSAGGIVTRPSEMPNMHVIIPKYISERLNPLTFYHKDANAFSILSPREDIVSHGWDGFGPDQEMWRFLKKAMPTRHLIQEQSLKRIREVEIPENHFMKRLIAQLISEGSEYADIHTQESIFNVV